MIVKMRIIIGLGLLIFSFPFIGVSVRRAAQPQNGPEIIDAADPMVAFGDWFIWLFLPFMIGMVLFVVGVRLLQGGNRSITA
ncbi:MAG: hypothetical protein BRD51_01830 [Bacteroidetes bacterium SW_11_64_17]|nr:MAG: hypothetical protein BRD51_01830 [Bacteroidetes bacterium SW_11_64_17]